MASNTSAQRPLGYPQLDKVQRGCRYTAQITPQTVYIICSAQLYNLSKQRTAAVLQVFKINTLVDSWMRRDLGERDPVARFAHLRKPNSTSYRTHAIADEITKYLCAPAIP